MPFSPSVRGPTVGRTSLARSPASASLCTRVTELCACWQAGSLPAVDTPDVTAMLADWQATAVQVAQTHGGRWSAAADFTVSATFGAVSGQPDHAERAMRCGQAWLAAALAHVEITRQRWPQLDHRLSVGAHTGPPAADTLAEAPQHLTADGAARIAQAVPPGRLGISLETAAQVRGLFDVEPPVPLPADRHHPPVQTLLLRLDSSRPERDPTPTGDAPRRRMVGREPELAILQAAFTRLLDGHPAQAVTVLASGGMGKSRLMRAFDDWSAGQPVAFHTWRARAQPQTRGQPFGLLRELVRTFCQISDADTPQAAQHQLEQAIAPWFVQDEGTDRAASHAHALGHLIGVDVRDSPHIKGILKDPQHLRQLAFKAAALWLRRLGANGGAPVLMQIEDLHWADDDTLDFLDHLMVVNHDVALLIVATGRPDLADRRPAWARSEGVHRHVDLGPLDASCGRRLAESLLVRLPAIPAALLDRLVQGSEGNPLCIEERIRLLIDQGVILTRIGSWWSIDLARLRSARLPNTLADVLKARLALLPAAERRTLQRASVIGPLFLEPALLALGAATAQTLNALLHRGLTLSHSAPGADNLPQFGFKHQLLQELTYGTVPTLTRRALHGKLARWLVAGWAGVHANEVLGLSAQHFELAGDLGKAAEQHALAAEHAVSRYAAAAVFDHVERGLMLLATLPASRAHRELQWRLRMTRVFVLETRGQHARHLADIDALTALSDELGDDLKRAKVADKRCTYAMLTADAAGAMAAARQTMACAERVGDDRLQLLGMRMVAWAHCGLGDWDAGHRLLKECLARALVLQMPEIEAACANTLSQVAFRQQDMVARLHWSERELTLRRHLGDRRQESMCLANLGGSWLALGELFQSRHCCEEALQLARVRGERRSECFPLYHLSILERWLGNGAQAAALARSAVDVALATGIKDFELYTLTALGEAELASGQLDAAQDAFLRAQDLALQRKRPDEPDNVAGLARLALARGDVPEALRQVQRVLDQEAATGVAHQARNQGRVNLVCYLVLARAVDPRAEAWLQRAHGQLLATAARISDEALREGFLANIPDHRAILAAWASSGQVERQARQGEVGIR